MYSSFAPISVTYKCCILLSWDLFKESQLLLWFWKDGNTMWNSLFDKFWAFKATTPILGKEMVRRKCKTRVLSRYYQWMTMERVKSVSIVARAIFGKISPYRPANFACKFLRRCVLETFWWLSPVASQTQSSDRWHIITSSRSWLARLIELARLPRIPKILQCGSARTKLLRVGSFGSRERVFTSPSQYTARAHLYLQGSLLLLLAPLRHTIY